MKLELTVNGQSHIIETDPRETLLSVLRERLELRGSKYGCGEGECGACTVILNGCTVASCLVPAGQAHGGEILTIEGMARVPIGQRLLEEFAKRGAVQCGFCSPGFVLSAYTLLANNPSPTLNEIQQALAGNLCRCTGYAQIVEAVVAASEKGSAAQGPRGEKRGAENEGRGAGSEDAFARPGSLDEALALLAQDQGWRIVSGNTDIGVTYEYRTKAHRWLDLSGIAELASIVAENGALILGSGVTYSQLLQSAAVQQWARPLNQAAASVGGEQIRNMGTLAGNLVNGSPAADAVVALMVLEATVTLCSASGERTLPVDQLATGPGQTVVAPDEILTRVTIPKTHRQRDEIAFFEKLGPRRAQAIAIGSVALRGWQVKDHLERVRVALGAVAPTVMLAPRTAEYLMAGPLTEERILQAGEIAAEECRPIDDIRGSAAYRRRLVRGLLIRGLWPHAV